MVRTVQDAGIELPILRGIGVLPIFRCEWNTVDCLIHGVHTWESFKSPFVSS